MTDEGKVAAINVVQVTEVTSSNAMEKEGFERCIQQTEQRFRKKADIPCNRPTRTHGQACLLVNISIHA